MANEENKINPAASTVRMNPPCRHEHAYAANVAENIGTDTD